MPRRSREALASQFGAARPRILIEPGRYLVGDAGLLRTEVLLISRKSAGERERWVYLDAGLYNGLDETLNERIHYRIRTPRDGGACGPVILAGPTCDSADILYRRHPYQLPLDLEIGDPVDFLSAGAYTASVPRLRSTDFRRSRATSSRNERRRQLIQFNPKAVIRDAGSDLALLAQATDHRPQNPLIGAEDLRTAMGENSGAYLRFAAPVAEQRSAIPFPRP